MPRRKGQQEDTAAVETSTGHTCKAYKGPGTSRMVQCGNCEDWYHYACVGITEDVEHQDFLCFSCEVAKGARRKRKTSAKSQPGGMYLLQLFDWYSASISVILVCIVEVIAVAWIYGVRNFVRDVEFMIDQPVERFWILSWKFVTPIILICIFFTTIVHNTEVTYNGVEYPQWAIAVGWMSCISSMMCIPAYALYKIVTTKGRCLERIKANLIPYDWGPADEPQKSLWHSHVEMNHIK